MNLEQYPLTVSEEGILRKYPLTFDDLKDKLKKKYPNISFNREFCKVKKELEDPVKHGEKYCKVRYLNSKTKKSRQKFYNTEIIKEIGKRLRL